MIRMTHHFIIGAAILALTACDGTNFNRESGAQVDEGGFGAATMNNTQLMTGEIEATEALGNRFANETHPTITFAFNSAVLDDQARATLHEHGNSRRQFLEVRFKVYGHTDLVGSDSYNKALGMRRARAAVAYLTSQGIGSARLEAVVSFGKTRPVIQTPGPEQQNRRTVTEVSGFVNRKAMLLNGKYAAVVMREYLKYGTRPHPDNSVIVTDVAGATGN